MKKVFRRNNYCNMVELDNVDENKYYLVKDFNETIGIIAREQYGCGQYRIFCLDSFTKSNKLGYANSNLQGLIREILESCSQSYEVLEFDTFVEMAKYISENS